MAKTNKQYLEETLTDEQQEWFDGMVSDHHKECRDKEEKIDRLNEIRFELEKGHDLLDQNQFNGTTIETGIGQIKYEIEGSLHLQQIMEALAEAIKQEGATAVLRKLEETYAV